MTDGSRDIAAAARVLADHLPGPLEPLARLAMNYRWSWSPAAAALFADIDHDRWERCGNNPARLLQEVPPARLEALAADAGFVSRLGDVDGRISAELGAPPAAGTDPDHPVAFICAEFGIHRSLPFYAGGLGVLAGDLLKEASDQRIPLVGLGLFYAEGSFHQRVDASGWQHEYWLETDSDRLPAAIVTRESGEELTVNVVIGGHPVSARVWRVDVGRSVLYLLDTNRPQNLAIDRWITSRLYVSHAEMRLAQYKLLGVGSIRALAAMGIRPSVVHLNEGHAALGLLEMLREEIAGGAPPEEARRRVRTRTAFTTHTPVAAGHPAFPENTVRFHLGDLPAEAGISWEELHALGRSAPDGGDDTFGLTPFALQLAGRANAVSALHGRVTRRMWAHLWPGLPEEDVPIDHVTNGVHAPTWTAPAMEELLARHVPRWPPPPRDSEAWAYVDAIPLADLWRVRSQLRARLAAYVRQRSIRERLGRGEPSSYAELAAIAWRDDVLTVGFARRIATYKRLHLLTRNLERGLRIMNGPYPVQVVIAGRAHPQDDDAKRTVQAIFALNTIPNLAGKVVFLEEHDLAMEAILVQGCDLWINLPRPLQEASGTSGMKAALNGGLNLSVLDGWWDEAFDGENGWGIASDPALSYEEQDARDSTALFDLLEHEVLPLFYDRDGEGLPRQWIRRMKRSIRTAGERFTAARMLSDYAARWHAAGFPAEG